MLIAKGELTGSGGHILRGTFTFETVDGTTTLKTSENFLFDGSPEPGWALMNTPPVSTFDAATRAAAAGNFIGLLHPATEYPHPEILGLQTLVVPQSFDVSKYSHLFLWCYETPFLLGVGRFDRKGVRDDDV